MIAGKTGFSLWRERDRERKREEERGRERQGERNREELRVHTVATWVVMDCGSLNNTPIFTFGI